MSEIRAVRVEPLLMRHQNIATRVGYASYPQEKHFLVFFTRLSISKLKTSLNIAMAATLNVQTSTQILGAFGGIAATNSFN